MSALEAELTPGRPLRSSAAKTTSLKGASLTCIAPAPIRLPKAKVADAAPALVDAVYHDPGARAVKMVAEIEDRVAEDLDSLEHAIELRADGTAWYIRRFDHVIKDLRKARTELQVARSDAHGVRAGLRTGNLAALRDASLLCRRLEAAQAALQQAFDRIKDPGTLSMHQEEECGFCAHHVKPLVHQVLGGTILSKLRAENALSDACRALA